MIRISRKQMDYARELRKEIKNQMGINVPDIPTVFDPVIDIMFLERFLHANGRGDVEKATWEKLIRG